MKRKINIYTELTLETKIKRLALLLIGLYCIGAGLYLPIAGGFNWIEKKVFNGAVNNYKSCMSDLEFSIEETNKARNGL